MQDLVPFLAFCFTKLYHKLGDRKEPDDVYQEEYPLIQQHYSVHNLSLYNRLLVLLPFPHSAMQAEGCCEAVSRKIPSGKKIISTRFVSEKKRLGL